MRCAPKFLPAALLLMFLLLPGALLSSQALATATGAGGSQVAIGAGMVNTGFEGLFIEAGVVIEEYLYLGIGWNLGFGAIEEEEAKDSIIRGVCTIPIISQDDYRPFSVLLTGVFEKISTESAYLDANGLIRTGTGYQAAVDLVKDFRGGEGVLFRSALSGAYSSGVLITEPAVDSVAADDPVQERFTMYLYGVKFGLHTAVNEGMMFGMNFSGQLDDDYRFHYGLIFSVSAFK